MEDTLLEVPLSEEVWKDKLELLGGLKLRDDDDGYQMAENLVARRNCMGARRNFLNKLELELLQRERSPTERDQVEALILSLVDRVSGAEKLRQKGGKIRDQSWHVASNGHTLASLRQKEPFDDTFSRDNTQPQSPKIDVKFEENKSSLVTDLPFVDILITPSALMLPIMRIEPKPMPFDRNDNGPNVVSLYDEKINPILCTLSKQKAFFVQGVSGLLRLGFRNKVPLISEKGNDNSEDLNIQNKNLENEIKLSSKGVSNKIIVGENFVSAATTLSAENQNSHMVKTISSRVNQIRGHEKKYEDVVTITVTALLDPPPHYILRPPQSQFPLAIASYTNITNNLNLPIARPVGIGNASLKIIKEITAIKESTPMVGTGGYPGHYTMFCKSNLVPPPTVFKDVPKGLNDDEIYYSNGIASADDDGVNYKTNAEKLLKLKEKKMKDKERLIMDQSARKVFEEQFRTEIALACCIPADNINIEEIRRLDGKDPRLHELRAEHTAMLAAGAKVKEDEEIHIVLERKARKDLAESVEKPRLMQIKRRISIEAERRNSVIPALSDLSGLGVKLYKGPLNENQIKAAFLSSEDELNNIPNMPLVNLSLLHEDQMKGSFFFSEDRASNMPNMPSVNLDEFIIGAAEYVEANIEDEDNEDEVDNSYSQTIEAGYDDAHPSPSLNQSLDKRLHQSLNQRLLSTVLNELPPNFQAVDIPISIMKRRQSTENFEAVEHLEERLAKLRLNGKVFLREKIAAADRITLLPGMAAALSSIVAEVSDQTQDILVGSGFIDAMHAISDWSAVAVEMVVEANKTVNLDNIQGHRMRKEIVQGDASMASKDAPGCLEPLIAMIRDRKPPQLSDVNWAKKGIVGCEITFTIHLTDIQRQELDVPDWKAVDIPLLLAQQMLEWDSPLRSGIYTRHILDFHFKETHKRRQFKIWEDFWLYSLHPVYFGRNATSMEKKKNIDSKASLLFPSSPQNKKDGKGSENKIVTRLKLIQGMDHNTPVHNFSLRSIRAFLSLPSEVAKPLVDGISDDKWTLVGLPAPTPRLKLLIEDYKTMLDISPRIDNQQLIGFKKEVNLIEENLELSENDSLDDEEGLQNMGLKPRTAILKFYVGSLTPSLIDRLQAQYLAAEEAVEEQLKGGLVDGVRLKIEQLVAMKARDAAKRIYNSAKQAFHQKQRKSNQLPVDANLIQMQLTEVKPEKFERWIREMKREELKELKVRQKAVVMMRSLRKQETEMKEVFGALRLWLIKAMISNYHHSEPNAIELLSRLNEELKHQKNKSASLESSAGLSAAALAVERQKQTVLRNMASVSEAKRTRELLGVALIWVKRVKALCEARKVVGKSTKRKADNQKSSFISDNQKSFRSLSRNHSGINDCSSLNDSGTSGKDSGLEDIPEFINKMERKISRGNSSVGKGGVRVIKLNASKLMCAMASRGKEGKERVAAEEYLSRVLNGTENLMPSRENSRIFRNPSIKKDKGQFKFSRSYSGISRTSNEGNTGRQSQDSDDDDSYLNGNNGADENGDDGAAVSIKKVYLMSFIETVRLSLANRQYEVRMEHREAKAAKQAEIEEQRQARMEQMRAEKEASSGKSNYKGSSRGFNKQNSTIKQNSIIKQNSKLSHDGSLNSILNRQGSILNQTRKSQLNMSLDGNLNSMLKQGKQASKLNPIGQDGSLSSVLNRQTSRFMKQGSRLSRKDSNDSADSDSSTSSTVLSTSQIKSKSRFMNNSFLMAAIDDDDDDDLVKPFPVPFELQLSDEELALSEQVFWFSQVLGSPDLLRCLESMPTGIGSSKEGEDPVINEVDSISKSTRSVADVIAREELCQFASIVMEVEPAWKKLLGDLSKDRMDIEERKKALMLKEKQYDAYLLGLKQEEDLKILRNTASVDGLEGVGGTREGSIAVSQESSRVKKEEAWLTSHPHTYVMPSRERGQRQGETKRMEPFCTVCKSHIYEVRIEAFLSAEAKALQYFNHALERHTKQLHHNIRKCVLEGDSMEKFYPLPPTLSRKTINNLKMRLQIKEINPILYLSGLSFYGPLDGELLPIVNICPIDDQILPEKDKSFAITSRENSISTFWPTDFLANIIIRIWYIEDNGNKGELLGYVFLDDTIISASSRGTRTYPVVFMGEDIDKTASTKTEESNDIFEGIKSVLYERKKKDRTLGSISSSLKATLSLKLYSTHSNKSSGEPDKWRLELLRAHGLPKARNNISINSSAQESKFHDANARWRPKVAVQNPLSNVVCEVLWRGPANFVYATGLNLETPLKKIRESEDEHEIEEDVLETEDKHIVPEGEKTFQAVIDINIDPVKSKHRSKTRTKPTIVDSWISLGCTAAKGIPNSSAEDPRFGAKDAGDLSGVFDLPPVWISIISGRQMAAPVSEKESRKSPGDWMPRNYLTRPHSNSKKENGVRSLRLYILAQAVVCLLRIQKLVIKHPDMSIIRRRMDIFRFLGHAEEEERRCMAKEEIRTKIHNKSTEEEKYQLLAEQQVIIAAKFSSVMNLLQCPTRTLSRLRFYMGVMLEGGGMRVMCQDPVHPSESSRSIVELFVMPLMYPEDEDEMRMHVESIAVVSRSNPVVTPVVELSVHTLKGFTAMGFAGFETRTAFTLVERYETKPTLCEYLRGLKNATDHQFYALIVQILEGLAALHKEGIIHRNFHKDCVFIEAKSPISVLNRNSEPISEFSSIILQDINFTSNSILIVDHDKDIKPECRISDFWFLRSPRGPGCVYSQGRADWGDKSTAPPEVRGGYKISYVSDIYAFGLCVLQWSKCLDQHKDIDLDKNTDSNHIAKKVNVKNIANDIVLGFGTAETKILPPTDPLKSLGSLVPVRWGKNSWVQRMLRMILQENPRHRASAKDILIYLESVTFEDA